MPGALGYVNAQFGLKPAEVHRALMRCAQLRGSRLRAVYVEHPSDLPDAFQRLVEHVERLRIRVVVVPSLHHLALLGDPLIVKRHLEHFIDGEVATAVGQPRTTGPTC